MVTRTVYDNNGRVVFTTDPFVDGQTTDIRGAQTVYDDLGRIVETRRIKHLDVQLTADPLNAGLQVSSVANAGTLVVLSTVKTRYDDKGRMHETESATGVVTRYAYDNGGRQTSVTIDPDDAFGLKAVTTYAYDDAGRQTRITDALGRVTEYVYDNLGRVVQTTRHGDLNDLSDNLVTTTEYDSLGRQVAQTDALNRRTVYNHDDAGRLTDVTLPEVTDAAGTGSTTGSSTYTYGYDDYGNQTSVTDPNQRTTTFTYDHLGRQLTRTLPLGQVESMHYDDRALSEVTNLAASTALGQLAYSVDFEGNVTAYLYDNTAAGGGRLVEKRYYDASQVTGTVAVGETPAALAARLGVAERIVTYKHDALGRQIEVKIDRDPANPNTDLHTTSTQYDAENRIKQVASPEGVINYEYDDLGRHRATETTNTRTEYDYDKLGRMTEVRLTEREGATLANAETTKYHYDVAGNLDLTEQPNGVVIDYIYDAFNRLDIMRHFVDQTGGTSLVYDAGTDTLKAEFDYEVDAAGNRTGAQEIVDGQTYDWTWAYDSLNRLASEQLDASDDSLDYTTTFSFDLASNRTEMRKDEGSDGATTPDEVTTYEYDANDRLLVERLDNNDDGTVDETTTYAYGDNADFSNPQNIYGGDHTTQTEKTVRSGDTTTGTFTSRTTFEYNAMGRLAKTEKFSNGSTTPDTSTTYTYDDRGLHVTETTGSDTKEYLFDAQNPTGYAQVLEEYVNDALNRTYTLGHDVITQADTAAATTGAAIHHLLYDGHGSTRVVLDHVAASVQQFAYTAYGVMLEGTALTTATDALVHLLYSGEWTRNDGTQWLRGRDSYDPRTGRFIQSDPLRTTDPIALHKYLYVHANPVMGIDPTGHGWTLVGRLAVASITGALFAVLGNGLYNVSNDQAFFDNAGRAASLGGVLGPLAVTFPFLAVTLAGAGLGLSVNNAMNVYGNPNATAGQKTAATFLVGLSVFGALSAASYGSSVSGRSFWINTRGLGAPSSAGVFQTQLRSIQTRISELHAAIPQGSRGRITLAYALAKDAAGNIVKIVGTSEKNGYIRPQVRAILAADEVVAPGQGHAEVNVVTFAQAQGWQIIAVGATRPVCTPCAVALAERGVPSATPLKEAAIADVFPILGQ